MNIFLTFDYELFFGENPGTVRKCMIEPTDALRSIASKHDVRLVFFVDVGYLLRAKEFAEQSEELTGDLKLVEDQIKLLVKEGHDVQLHIHPHWEKSLYTNGMWKICTDGAYKLDDFSDDEVRSIVVRYKNYLDDLIGYKTTCFRAGGWCIQPFRRWKDLFKELGLKYDSSVFPGGKFSSPHYDFDFTKAPKKSVYRFEDDVCEEDANGYFTEYTISSWRYSPLFYWRLYIWGRLNPARHKMLGDGIFLSQPGRKRSVLTSFTWNHVSADGFYASKLERIFNTFRKEGREEMVIIAHPKSLTRFSIDRLDQFIGSVKNKAEFKIFKQLP
jgi:hypothetical protein